MDAESGVMPEDVESGTEGKRVFAAVVVLFVVNCFAAYFLPWTAIHADPPQLLGGIVALQTVVIVQLGLLIPAVIIAGVITMFPTERTFNERRFRALR
jgi:hypothetical protein